MKKTEIKIEDIKYDESIYPRVKHSEKQIEEMKEYIKEMMDEKGLRLNEAIAKFPEIVVATIEEKSDGKYYLVDGYHRLRAYTQLAMELGEILDFVPAVVLSLKKMEEALKESVLRNAKHGLKLTDEDLKSAFKKAISKYYVELLKGKLDGANMIKRIIEKIHVEKNKYFSGKRNKVKLAVDSTKDIVEEISNTFFVPYIQEMLEDEAKLMVRNGVSSLKEFTERLAKLIKSNYVSVEQDARRTFEAFVDIGAVPSPEDTVFIKMIEEIVETYKQELGIEEDEVVLAEEEIEQIESNLSRRRKPKEEEVEDVVEEIAEAYDTEDYLVVHDTEMALEISDQLYGIIRAIKDSKDINNEAKRNLKKTLENLNKIVKIIEKILEE